MKGERKHRAKVARTEEFIKRDAEELAANAREAGHMGQISAIAEMAPLQAAVAALACWRFRLGVDSTDAAEFEGTLLLMAATVRVRRDEQDSQDGGQES